MGSPRSSQAAVALLIFNRPALTARVFSAIASVRPSQLFVVGDGPREDNSDDPHLVRQARSVIDDVDWPCDVHACYSDVNLGCKLRIASGLDWLFDHVDSAIILEDDCVPDQSFFPFCNELLDRYRDDERVHMVGGVNLLAPEQSGNYSYYFSRCYHIWGWATWKRAWQKYDLEMRDWPELRHTGWLERQIGNEARARAVSAIFDQTHAGKVPTWDFQWVFSGWVHDAVSVIPRVNLITNIGYGEAATHGHNVHHPAANLPTWQVAFPLRHPPSIEVLKEADRAEWALGFPKYFPRPRRLVARRVCAALKRRFAFVCKARSMRA